MIAHPEGWLSRVATLVRGHQTLLIADEVMTGFGRVGCQGARSVRAAPLFACHGEGVQPDFLCLAKGLAGGYLPLAATLTTLEVFAAFLGEYSDFKTFFHGHSFTANQLGTAVARANLQLLQTAESLRARRALEAAFSQELLSLWALPQVGDIRQAGLVAGIELVRDWRTREPFDLREQAGIRVCAEMARLGVLTRPIGNVVVLMPPYCTTRSQLHRMVKTVARAVSGVQASP
jgi:adenosylmethionine-8-amino-7-oxononanoate aminotransferase